MINHFMEDETRLPRKPKHNEQIFLHNEYVV